MAQIQRSQRLVQKAEAALVSAIEIYNKPDFRYREETFSILAATAWELLLKARLLREHGNNEKCLWVYERRPNRKGVLSKKLYKRRNRSGNPATIGLAKVITELEKKKIEVPTAVRRNLVALLEIRDNAVHYINAGPFLAKQVLEIGTASVVNFVRLGKEWFGLDLSKCSLYLMPIGFAPVPAQGSLVVASTDEKKVIEYLSKLIKAEDIGPSDPYQVSLALNLRLKKSSAGDSIKVSVSKDPDAIKVELSEEDIRKQFPWDYEKLTQQCRNRYSDFKVNQKYHGIRRPLTSDARFCRVRYLDEQNPRSAKKEYFHQRILDELDKHYAKR